MRIILFQRPSYRSRISRQLFRSKGLAELIERRCLNCRQIQRSVFPNGRRNSVCGDRSQPSRGIDRQRNVVTLDVAGTSIDLGRIFFQCLECSVFERNHIRLGGNPFKAAAGHFSAILIVAGSGKLICKNRIFIQPQDKTVLHVGANCLEGRLLLDLNNDILCSLAGRGRGGFQNHIRIGSIRDTANRNEQFSVFNRGIGLIGVCQRPLDVRRNSAGIAVLIARQQRNAGQIILCALYCGGSAVIIIQLIQIRLCRHLYGQRLCRPIDRFALLVLSDRIIQGNRIRADYKTGDYAAADFGIALVRGKPPLEQAIVKRHVLTVLILGLHIERAQVKGIRRIIIIDEIGNRAVHGQRIELPFGQNLQRYTVGFRAVHYGINLIGSRCGKLDAARGFVNRNVIVCFCIPLDLASYIKIIAGLVQSGHSQCGNIGGVAAVVEVERLKAALYRNRGKHNGQDGQFNQLAVEIIRCFDRILRLIAQEQLCSVIRLERIQNRVAVAVCRDLGILRSVVQTFVHNRPFAAQPWIEAVPVHVVFVFRLDLDAVQTQALLLVQRNLFGIRHQTIERIDRVHLLRGDDGVLGGVVERTEVRCNRLTGAQLIGCRLEFALIQGNHIQTVGVVAGDSPVLDAGIQILDRASAVPAEGILLKLPSFPAVHRDTIPLGSMITGNREEHGLILDVHRAGIGDGRLQVGHIDIDVNARMCRQRYGDGIRNRLCVGLLLAALVGLFHAIGVGKTLLHLGSGRKRGQNGHAEFNAYRGLLGPVL